MRRNTDLTYYSPRKALVVFTLLLLNIFSPTSLANRYISHESSQNTLFIKTELGQVSLSAYSQQAIEVHYNFSDSIKNTIATNAANLPSFAIKENAHKQAFSLSSTPKSLAFSAGKLSAIITKSPFNISFYKNNVESKQQILSEESGYFEGFALEDDKKYAIQGFRFTLNKSEKLMGGGERVLGMDRRGHRMPLYNRAHYGYETQSNQMNFSIPAVLSSNKYILLFDNSAKGWMDLGKTDKNIMQFEAVSGRMAYIVFAGETYPDLIQNYVNVTGKQPMPPRWALGNYASRFGYRTQQEVQNTINKFIAADIPLDNIILDLYWFGKDIKGHMGNLVWDSNAFPTPKKMISDNKAKGVNTILITEPFILTTSKQWQSAQQSQALAKNTQGEPKQFDFYFGHTGLVDVFNKHGQQWFNNIYKGLYQQGIAGWWGDLGEPEVHPSDTLHTMANGDVVKADAIHNVYGHQWAKMVYENQLKMAPTKRPFILMRSGFAGSQRYGMIPWTGDVSRSWGGLKPQVELSLQMSLLGMAYTHSDLGGFAGGETFNKALYIRWLQYGVFQPIYRPHGQDHIASEVVFHDQETQDIIRKFIKLRYQLLPYNYSLAYQNSTTGMPLMRPLFFEDDTDLTLIDNSKSYLWGNAFLVTPIVDPAIKKVEIPLPKGVWFDYFTQKKYQGEQTIELATPLNTLPVLVRAGSFIPMVNAVQSTKDYSSKQLTIHYYADSSVTSSGYQMYEDDGEMFHATKQGAFELLYFDATQNKKGLAITLSHNNNSYIGMPKQRDINLVIHHWPKKPNRVTIANQQNVKQIWDKEQQTLTLSFSWQQHPLTINIE